MAVSNLECWNSLSGRAMEVTGTGGSKAGGTERGLEWKAAGTTAHETTDDRRRRLLGPVPP